MILNVENYRAFGQFSDSIRDIYRDPVMHAIRGRMYLKEDLALVAATMAVAGIIIAIAVYIVPGDKEKN